MSEQGSVPHFIATSRLPVSAGAAFAWHERSGAFERLAPPWDAPKVLERTGTIRDGDRLVVQMKVGPLPVRWEAVHEGYVAGERFVDRQVAGPFSSWRHTHQVVAAGADECLWEDAISYAAPGGAIGRALGGSRIEQRLCALFAHRHAQLAADLVRHRDARIGRPLRVAVSGASGLIGSALTAFLTTGEHEVLRLVRRSTERSSEIAWDPMGGTVDQEKLEGLDAVVHLAAESLAAGRWSEERKRRLSESRTRGTATLAQAISRLNAPPPVFVSASAVGFYGARTELPVDETAPAGDDYLGTMARAWEEASAPAAARGVRVVLPRLGVVLSPQGGMLERLLPIFRAGLGGRVGDGKQGLSWIALDDVVGVLHRMLHDEALTGPVNVVAPAPTTNRVLSETLADVLGRPSLFTVPSAAVKVAFGEMGETLLLRGPLVRPARLVAADFRYRFPELKDALTWMLGKMATPAPVRDGRALRLTL